MEVLRDILVTFSIFFLGFSFLAMLSAEDVHPVQFAQWFILVAIAFILADIAASLRVAGD